MRLRIPREVPDRRRAERELLDEYFGALALSPDRLPSREEMWSSYRASAVYGLVNGLSTLGSAGHQAPEMSRALVERFVAAFSSPGTRTAPG